MRVPYDSEEGLDIGRKVMRFVRTEADRMSTELAEERGVFPAFAGSIYDAPGQPRMRNACRLTVAPTGTISMIADCSSGIEPLFALCYHKHSILEGESLLYVNKGFEDAAREGGFYSEDLMQYLADGGSLQERDDVPDWAKRVFVTSADISPEMHVRMQGVFQESVDAAISKTINFPNSATEEDVRSAYMLAWELACKGITVYRAGSREAEVLTAGEDKTGEATDEVCRGTAPGAGGAPAPVGTFAASPSASGRRTATCSSPSTWTRTGPALRGLRDPGQGWQHRVRPPGGRLSAGDYGTASWGGLLPRSSSHLRGITDEPVWDGGTLVRSAPDAVALVLDRHFGPDAGQDQPLKQIAAPDRSVQSGDVPREERFAAKGHQRTRRRPDRPAVPRLRRRLASAPRRLQALPRVRLQQVRVGALFGL